MDFSQLFSKSKIAIVSFDDVNFPIDIQKPVSFEMFLSLAKRCEDMTVGFPDKPRQVDHSVRDCRGTKNVFFDPQFLSNFQKLVSLHLQTKNVSIDFNYVLLYTGNGGFTSHVDRDHANCLGRYVLDIPVEGGCTYERMISGQTDVVASDKPFVSFIPFKGEHSVQMKTGNRMCIVFVVSKLLTTHEELHQECRFKTLESRLTLIEDYMNRSKGTGWSSSFGAPAFGATGSSFGDPRFPAPASAFDIPGFGAPSRRAFGGHNEFVGHGAFGVPVETAFS
jgi:hypothetical protein